MYLGRWNGLINVNKKEKEKKMCNYQYRRGLSDDLTRNSSYNTCQERDKKISGPTGDESFASRAKSPTSFLPPSKEMVPLKKPSTDEFLGSLTVIFYLLFGFPFLIDESWYEYLTNYVALTPFSFFACFSRPWQSCSTTRYFVSVRWRPVN